MKLCKVCLDFKLNQTLPNTKVEVMKTHGQLITSLFFLTSFSMTTVKANPKKPVSVTVPGYVTCGLVKMDRKSDSDIPDRLVFLDWSQPNPVPTPFGMLWDKFKVGTLSSDALKTKDKLESIFFTKNENGENELNEDAADKGVLVKTVYLSSSRLMSKDTDFMFLTPNVLVPKQFLDVEIIDASTCKKILGLPAPTKK